MAVRVALTFDDGPVLPWTDQILDAFAEHGGHGTFFVLATRVIQHPWLVSRMLNEGHEVGIHGYDHVSWPHLEPAKLKHDLNRAIMIVRTCARWDSPWEAKWCRPPHHARNAEVDRVVKELGLTIVGTSLDPGDWFKDAAGTEEHIRRCLHPGANIDLHDAVAPGEEGSRDGTVTAVRNLLSDGTIESVTCSAL